jgi:hypothetical protein
MAYIKLPGGIYCPDWGAISAGFTFNTTNVIDATGEKACAFGRVVWHDGATSKDIAKVGIRFGPVTKAGGSGMILSLQDVSLSAGAPPRPDETQDQTYAIANGNASFASNTYLHSGALSSNRTVNYGDLIAVVLEYDGSGRLGADSVVMSSYTTVTDMPENQLGMVLKTASWAASGGLPIVIFEFTDGTFGTLEGTWPLSASGTLTFKQDDSPDEYAQKFRFPFSGKIDGCWIAYSQTSGAADFDAVIYGSDGSTVLATRTMDANVRMGALRFSRVLFASEIPFAANTTYYFAVKPTQTSASAQVLYAEVSAAAHFGAFFGGADWCLSSRTNEGVWTDTTTRRLFAGVRVSSIGQPILLHPGMSGGMRG